MRTRASAKRDAQGNAAEAQVVAVQAPVDDEQPQKRARRRGPAQPMRGGWDELPHNLGTIKLGPKETTAPDAKETFSPIVPGPTLPPTPDSSFRNGSNVGQAKAEAGPAATLAQQPALKTETDGSLPSPPLDTKGNKYEKALVPKRVRRKTKDNPYGLMFGRTPYPDWRGPSIEAAEEVHRLLTELHGEVTAPTAIPPPSLSVAGCGEVPSVLDALMRTLLSAATTMVAANEAFTALVNKYGTVRTGIGKGSVNWKKVRAGPVSELAETIKHGGLANTKAADMKKILDMVWEDRKALSLDHLHGKTAREAMEELVRYPRVGVKTAACVILFCLRVPCFAVDTHVHRFCRWLGWVPAAASAEMMFWHCEFLVPDRLKYGLHQLFIRHGQLCARCRADTAEGTEAWNGSSCVLEHLLERNKVRSTARIVLKVKEEAVEKPMEEDSAKSLVQAAAEEDMGGVGL